MLRAILSLRPILIFIAANVVLLTLSRLGMMVWHWERVAHTEGFGFILLQGLRFDLILLGMLVLVPALLTPLFATHDALARRWYPLLKLYLITAFAAVVFMEATTPAFILEYDTRPNRIFVEYLIYPREVMSMLATGYKLEIAATLIALALAIWGMWKLMHRYGHPPHRPHPFAALIVVPLILVVLFIDIRSSLGHRPANPSTVAFSGDPMVNTLPMSSLYHVLYSAYETLGEQDTEFVYGYMDEEEATRLVQRDLAPVTQAFYSPAIPTLHHQQATITRERPLNLVIVLEESLGAEFVGALGGLPLTPNLDRLANEGIWFDQLYATGTRSVRGIEAVVTGFTPTPAQSVVKLNRSQRNFFTLASLLAGQGYETSFIYGGEAHFDNMARFFTGNGFQRIIDERDFDATAFRGSWGVSDEDLFAKAHETFLAQDDRPFFSLVFTSSNHTPFEYPAGRIEPYDAEPATVNNAVKYADHALGRFIEQARQSPYWDNTLFLIVADHNSRVYGSELVPVERFHIPGVILGGQIRPDRIQTITSQIDLAPTLLSLMGISSDHPMIGHDLTRPEFRNTVGRAILQYNSTQAYLEGHDLVIMQPGQAITQYRHTAMGLVPDKLNPQLAEKALAHQVWTAMSYREGRYAPAMDAAKRTN